MFCKNCGTENTEGSKFCVNCGTPLEEAKTTPNTDIPPTDYAYPPYQQAPYGYNMPPVIQEPAKGFAIASLVLGILSFICCSPIFGPLGIIFGAVAKSKGNRSAMATAGIVCGIIALVLWVVVLATGITGEFTDAIIEGLNDGYYGY